LPLKWLEPHNTTTHIASMKPSDIAASILPLPVGLFASN
jgi:hypothetical protein